MHKRRVDFARGFAVCMVVAVAWAPAAAWADFCSGKQSGLWCDGSKLVTCSGGKVVKSVTCSAGCQSMPPGTPDQCKSGGFCSGKQSGLWCDGSKLVTCSGGNVVGSKSCTYGCQSMPPGTPDQCKSGGFCSGKASGKWCDGSKLVTCSGGNVVGSKSCSDGCQSMPSGTDDTCKAATNFCTGKASGKWCDGGKLVTCSGGKVVGSQTCASGCQSNPPGTDDACKSGGGGFCTGKASGKWCDGSKLVTCSGGAVVGSQACASGCQSNPPGTDDACKSGGGGFCTGKASGKWCDGGKLVTCSGGKVVGSQTCASGCQSNPPGTDDACKSGGGGFCTGKASGLWCEGSKLVTCSGGAVVGSQDCAQGCQSNPPGVPDACKAGGGGSGSGLVLCAPFKPSKAVTCGFGCYSGHKGSDYAAGQGTPVYAPMGGQAVLVKKTVPGQTCSPDFGNFVKIKNGDWEVILAHMGQDIPVNQGQTVKAGDPVGKVSNSGYTLAYKGGQWVCKQGGGHHLHLELRKKGTPVNAFGTSGVSWTSDCGQAGQGGTTPEGGFCADKQSGAWCDGATLVTCKSGAKVASKGCDYGCQSNPVGTPDACKGAPAGFCSGKADGAWCEGSALVTCKGGLQSAKTACDQGCQSNPPGTPDVCKAAAGFCSGKANGAWCKGDALVQCQGGKELGSKACAAGCQSMPGGVPDQCKAAAGWCASKANGLHCQGDTVTLCVAGVVSDEKLCPEGCAGAAGQAACKAVAPKGFCVGKVDGLWCDGAQLRTCAGGQSQGLVGCPFGCQSGGAAAPDSCKPNPKASDPCAPRPDGPWCQGDTLRVCKTGVTASKQLCAQGCGGAPAACVGAADFCAGKVSGVWCKGVTLVTCQGDKSVNTSLCPFGCASAGADQPDACLAANAALCTPPPAGQGDGMWCQGDVLATCLGGQLTGQVMCAKGCDANGAVGVASCADGAGLCQDKVGGAWCNGAALVSCLQGQAVAATVCKWGCTVTPGAAPDHCTDAGASGGSAVCVGQPNGALCDGDQRVHCNEGQEEGRTLCAYGCVGAAGGATCASSAADTCAGLKDGPQCVGPAVVTCASGAVVGVQGCPNGCSAAGACVQAGAGAAPGASVVVDAQGCASLAGAVSLTVAPQDQRPFSEPLGTCGDRTIADDGALVTSLSTVYAALGLPRTALGLSGNTPALENVWRNQNAGYQDCPGGLGRCCVRWDTNPGDLHWTGRKIADPTCWSAATATAVAASLNAGLPVVAAVHPPGQAPSQHWVVIAGVAAGELRIVDPWGGLSTAMSQGALGAYLVDAVALAHRDGDTTRVDAAGDALPGGPGALAGRVAPDTWLDAGGGPGGAPPGSGGCSVQRAPRDLPWAWLALLLAAFLGLRRGAEGQASRGRRRQ